MQNFLFQRGNYDKAESLFHIGLKMATDMGHQNGVTYVLDLMANLALEMVIQYRSLVSYTVDSTIKRRYGNGCKIGLICN